MKSTDNTNVEIVKKAGRFAKLWHSGQKRKDNVTDYFVHPERVVNLLISWGVENESILAAAYCHDLIEDTEVDSETLAREFDDSVAMLVGQLTKQQNINKQEYLNTLAEHGTVEALLIKTADRICNTYDFLNDGKTIKAYEYLHAADNVYKALSNNSAMLDRMVYTALCKSLTRY